MKRVALITYRALGGLDAQDAPLPAALEAEGLASDVVCWDAPDLVWSDYACALFRSPWDYFQRPAEFAAWLDRTESQTRLLNPPSVVRWNLHKKYLVELAGRGVRTVPTAVVQRGSTVPVATLARERGWTEVVIKPAISAGSWRTARFSDPALPEAQRHLDEVSADVDVLVQPFQPAVLGEREQSLVFIDGVFQFAVTKRSSFDQQRTSAAVAVRAETHPMAASDAALSLARAALSVASPGPLLYARVDLVRGADGELQVMELELFEPSLYLADFPATARALAKAVARRTG